MQEIVAEEGRSFDRVNVSTALHHLGSVLGHDRAQPAAVEQVDSGR